MSHETHWDPAVRELIARAEARGAERVAQAVERLADEFDAGWAAMTVASVSTRLRALLAECRGERPIPEDCDGSFICGARVHEHGCYADDAGYCNYPDEHPAPEVIHVARNPERAW